MFDNLIVCRNLLEDDIFRPITDKFQSTAKLIEHAENLGLSGNIWRSYLIYLLTHEPNLVSQTVEANGGKIGESLYIAFKHDIEVLFDVLKANSNFENLREIYNLESDLMNDFEICYDEADFNFEILENYTPTQKNKIESLANLESKLANLSDIAAMTDAFIDYYRNFGYGDIATYRAFRWDSEKKNLSGIKHFEKILLEDLIGYTHQKELLTKNTLAFLEGKPANNVLLVGSRGTGKSSGVKALVNEYYSQGLRLVQIAKPQLKKLPEIMDTLRSFSSKRFIIFLDDLSFEESEPEYKYLKSSIEGGVESRPENVLIYATSNRRHLIRETWRDRIDGQDELYRDDSVNETISLSDRFGLIIHYYEPTQTEYLEIIRHMLKKKNISLDDETLRLEGLRWEMSHSGRNGRTAQQFVNFYLGQN